MSNDAVNESELPEMSDLDFLPEDAFLVAMVDSSPVNELSSPTPISDDLEPDDDAQKHGFSSPENVSYGQSGQVMSVPLDFSIGPVAPIANQANQLPPPAPSLSNLIDIPAATLPPEVPPTTVIPELESEPSVANDIFWTAHQPNRDYNLTFVIDISGSMNLGISEGAPRINNAKEALVEFMSLYDMVADNLVIHIVPFSSNPDNQGAFVYTATDMDDAKDYVLKQGEHAQDGLAIGMINPNTGEPMGLGTQYNDALFHVRQALDADLQDPNFADYAPKIYFISDGRPNPGHGVFANDSWPESWSDWPTFIDDPQSDIPNSIIETIDTFAISVGLNPAVASSLQAVASKPEYVFAVNDSFADFSQTMLKTVPDLLIGNVVSNDSLSSGQLLSVSFRTPDPAQYLLDHELFEIGQASDTQVTVAIPHDGTYVAFATPQGGILHVKDSGHFYYLPPNSAHVVHESFDYAVMDEATGSVLEATFNINTIANETPIHNLVGHQSHDTLSSSGFDGVVMMTGGGGDNTFEIDLSNPPEAIIIHDLFDNAGNVLKFIGLDSPETSHLSDIIDSVTQTPGNASYNLELSLPSGNMMLYLDNLGPYTTTSFHEALDHIEQSVQVMFA